MKKVISKLKEISKNKKLAYGLHSAILIYVFCCLFGVTSTHFFSDIKLVFFLGSILFASTIIYLRDPHIHYKEEDKNNSFKGNKGTFLVVAYTVVYGISGFYLLKGIELSIFLLSYMFAITMFYLRSPDRIYGVEFKMSENGTIERLYLKKDFKYYLNAIFKHEDKKEVVKH